MSILNSRHEKEVSQLAAKADKLAQLIQPNREEGNDKGEKTDSL